MRLESKIEKRFLLFFLYFLNIFAPLLPILSRCKFFSIQTLCIEGAAAEAAATGRLRQTTTASTAAVVNTTIERPLLLKNAINAPSWQHSSFRSSSRPPQHRRAPLPLYSTIAVETASKRCYGAKFFQIKVHRIAETGFNLSSRQECCL